jgi:hypothetical protein
MKEQRGRKSAASLLIVPVTGIQRPEPPPEFTPEEAAVWTATTRAMKPNRWIPSNTLASPRHDGLQHCPGAQ